MKRLYAGELDYPTEQDVADAVAALGDHLRESKRQINERFAHFLDIEDLGVMPPLAVN